MSILFRCPCGRSMVVEDDRAGAVVMCPNCRRSLKVPSGKDRGVQISSAPAATKVRTSRLCQRCGKEVSVDSQMCPHCKAILLDAAPAATGRTGAATATAPARAAAAVVARPVAGAPAQAPILYGGARASWFSRLTPGAKAGVLGGAAGFALLLFIIGYFIYSAWYSGQVTAARQTAQNALAQGRKLENLGKFQDAYELYWAAMNYESYLAESVEPRDAELLDALKARITAFQYLVAQPKVKGSVYWKARNQAEYDAAKAEVLQKTYSQYREWLAVVADAGLAAAQFAAANPDNQPAFDAKVGSAMDAYVKFVAQTSEKQRALRTFQQLIEGLRSLAGANRNWAKPLDRDNYLKNTEGYLNAAKDFAARGDDDFWVR